MGEPAPTYLMPVYDRLMICVRRSSRDFVFYGFYGTRIEVTVKGDRLYVEGKERGRVKYVHEWQRLMAGSAMAVEAILEAA